MYVDVIHMTSISQRMRKDRKWIYRDAKLEVTDVFCNL